MTKSDDIIDDQTLGSFADGLLDATSSEKIIKANEWAELSRRGRRSYRMAASCCCTASSG